MIEIKNLSKSFSTSDGTVDALTYEDSQPAGSFLARLFG